VRYGLYDTVDLLWLGSDQGPKTFGAGDVLPSGPTRSGWTVVQRIRDDADALFFARAAAEAACHCVGWPPTRVRAREYTLETWRIVDEVEKTRTELDWVIRKERGTIA
jgi:hypothetical protein